MSSQKCLRDSAKSLNSNIKMKIFGKRKLSMGHISCIGSEYLAKERSKSSHRSMKDRSGIFEGDAEGDGVPAYNMLAKAVVGKGLLLPRG